MHDHVVQTTVMYCCHKSTSEFSCEWHYVNPETLVLR